MLEYQRTHTCYIRCEMLSYVGMYNVHVNIRIQDNIFAKIDRLVDTADKHDRLLYISNY